MVRVKCERGVPAAIYWTWLRVRTCQVIIGMQRWSAGELQRHGKPTDTAIMESLNERSG